MIDLGRIRERAHRAAHAKLAREVGEMVLGDSIAETERNWLRRYATLFMRAFAFFYALERCGSRQVAREIVSTKEVQHAVAKRVNRLAEDLDAAA